MGCKKAARQHLKRLGFVPHNAYYEIGAGRSERINNHIEMIVLFDRLIDPRHEWSITFLSQFSNFAKPALNWLEKGAKLAPD